VSRPATFDHLISKKKAVTKTVAIALDPELAEELEEARRARDLAQSRANARKDDSELQAQLWEAEERYAQAEERMGGDDAVAHFTFRSIGRAAFDALVDAHPPTPAQRAKAKSFGVNGEMQWNMDTFPPALVAACLVEPKLSAEEMLAIWRDDSWNQVELNDLFLAAVNVNGTRRTVDVGKGSKSTPSSARSSPTA
jgi:hypothetical protein